MATVAMLMLQTVLWVGAIAVLATVFGFPMAWALRTRGRWALGFALVPLLLPSYLAYAGWGILRDPMGPWGVGNWLGHMPPGVLVWTGKLLAVWGLALWASPLAAVCMLGPARAVGRDLVESLLVDEPASRRQSGKAAERQFGTVSSGAAGWAARVRTWGMKWWVVIGMMRGGIVASLVVVGVVMLGSAVPLHLAQAETYAIEIWRQLSLTTQPVEVWARAWPLLVVAVVVGWVVKWQMGKGANEQIGEGGGASRGGRGVDRSEQGATPPLPRTVPPPTSGKGSGKRGFGERSAVVASVVVWGLALVVPMALYVSALHTPGKGWSLEGLGHVLRGFWHGAWPAAVSSFWVSLTVAACALAVGMAVFCAAGVAGGATSPVRRGRLAARIVLGLLFMLAVLAIVPGVLVGSALLEGWTRLGLLGGPESPLARFCDRVVGSGAIVVLGDLLRFGFLSAAIGWWAARLEGKTIAEQRLLDGADLVRGWAAVNLWPGYGGPAAVAGAAIATGILAFHEIEATVILQPPGVESFSRLLLDNLHYARDDRTAAAAVSLVGVGVAAAWLAGGMLSVVLGRREPGASAGR